MKWWKWLFVLTLTLLPGCVEHAYLYRAGNPHHRTQISMRGVDSLADTLCFRYALPTSSVMPNWQCCEGGAILFFSELRAAGDWHYWQDVPKGTAFLVSAVVKEGERWTCVAVEPAASKPN